MWVERGDWDSVGRGQGVPTLALHSRRRSPSRLTGSVARSSLATAFAVPDHALATGTVISAAALHATKLLALDGHGDVLEA